MDRRGSDGRSAVLNSEGLEVLSGRARDPRKSPRALVSEENPLEGRESVKEGHLGGYFHGGDEATWSPKLWTRLVEQFDVRSVLDIGCGEGHSTKFFQGLGCDVLGLEGSEEALANSALPDRMVRHDFSKAPFVPDREFDLVWTCEFVEHVEHEFVANILRTLAAARKAVAMTHAFPGQHGHHHVNCQPNRYWIGLIEGQGFDLDLVHTLENRRVSFEDYPGINHFARSGLVFVPGEPASAAAIADPVAHAKRARAALESAQIGLRFKLSDEYRKRQRQRKARKRARKRARANPA